MSMQPQSAPGWYPVSPTEQRYWDGQQWTAQTARITQQAAYAQPRVMVTKSPRRTSHLLHLVMTILTGGIWGLLVWLPITIVHHMHREKSVTTIR